MQCPSVLGTVCALRCCAALRPFAAQRVLQCPIVRQSKAMIYSACLHGCPATSSKPAQPYEQQLQMPKSGSRGVANPVHTKQPLRMPPVPLQHAPYAMNALIIQSGLLRGVQAGPRILSNPWRLAICKPHSALPAYRHAAPSYDKNPSFSPFCFARRMRPCTCLLSTPTFLPKSLMTAHQRTAKSPSSRTSHNMQYCRPNNCCFAFLTA